MRAILHHLSRFSLANATWLLVAILAVPTSSRAQTSKSEPVEAFQKALDQDLDLLPDEMDPTGKEKRKELLDKREKSLKELAVKVTSLLDLAEILRGRFSEKHREMLRKDTRLREIDTAILSGMLDEFVKKINEIDSSKDTAKQSAVATLLGDMVNKNLAPELRKLIVEKVLTELNRLSKTNDPAIQTSVARAIGKIVLELRDVLGAPARLSIGATIREIQQSKSAEARLAVIDTAGSLVRVFNSKPGEESDQPVIPFKGDLDGLIPLTPILFVGLQDADADVRARSLEVLYRLNSLFNKDRQVFIPQSRPGVAPREFKMENLTDSYIKQDEVYRKTLLDPNAEVRLVSLQTLEELAQLNAYVRERVLNLQDSKPSEHPDTFLEPFLVKMTPEVVANLTHPNYRVRLAASQVIESRGNQARQPAAALVPRMDDGNLFVRWAAARALGRLSQPTIKGAVEGLGKLLSDDDLSVRMAAATSLEALGKEGRDATPELLTVVNAGDADFREVALRALGVVGPFANAAPLIPEKRNQIIVPVIAKELSHPDVRVRRAAAQALTRFGASSAVYAGKELKAALDDEDADVRRYATEALLVK